MIILQNKNNCEVWYYRNLAWLIHYNINLVYPWPPTHHSENSQKTQSQACWVLLKIDLEVRSLKEGNSEISAQRLSSYVTSIIALYHWVGEDSGQINLGHTKTSPYKKLDKEWYGLSIIDSFHISIGYYLRQAITSSCKSQLPTRENVDRTF